MRGYEIKMSSSAQAGECDALITVALGTPLAAGGRAAAGSPANGGKIR